MALSDKSLERILCAVGTEYMPIKIDRSALKVDIDDTWHDYSNEASLGLRRERHKQGLKTSKLTGELLKLLEDQKHGEWLRRQIRFSNAAFAELKVALMSLGSIGEMVARQQKQKSSIREVFRLTPLEWLVGLGLAEVYRRHFDRAAGRSRPAAGGTPRGPYVRFAVAVAREYGKRISDATVEDALKQVRKISRTPRGMGEKISKRKLSVPISTKPPQSS